MSFIKTGVLRRSVGNIKYFTHFGINPKYRSIYGVSYDETIYEIEFEIDTNQEHPNISNGIDYWGWLNNGDTEDKMTMIWPTLVQFRACFPYGFETEEACGKGKAYRLKIKSYKELIQK